MMDPDAEITPQWQIPWEQLTDWMRIGGGNFGNVYRAQYGATVVAVKELNKPDPNNPEDDDMGIYYQREMATLKELHHPNVMALLGLCKHNDHIYIISEFVEGGDLRRHLKNTGLKLSWPLRVKIATDCADAMAYLHRKQILHRDFKSKNLLVGPNWRVKVCDFGFARKMANQNEYMTLCGTDEWMAPEVMLGEIYDEKADVYSFGMVLVEIITRAKPVERSNASAPYDYEKLKLMTPPSCPYELFKICILCSQFYPQNRPTIHEALASLQALDAALTKGAVKTIADIQAEMARAAQEAAAESDGEGNASSADDDGPSSSSSSGDEGSEHEKLTVRVERVQERVDAPTQAADTHVDPDFQLRVNKPTPTSPVAVRRGNERFVRAVQSFEANDVHELSFKAGDQIQFGAADEGGWVFGTLNGASGWFPRAAVEEIPLEGAKPLFAHLDSAVDGSPLKKEDAVRALSAGLVHRPPPGELEQKGILKSSGEVKEKKLTLNMLFQKKNAKGAPSGGAAAPINVTLSEPDLDALVLQMADEQSGPGWSKGKKLLTLRSYDNVCQGGVLCRWLVDKGVASDDKEAVVLVELLLRREVIRDPAKGKLAFEKNTMYQLCLFVTPPEGAPLVLNGSKKWSEQPNATRGPVELATLFAKRMGAFFKPAPKDLSALGNEALFRALVLQTSELQAVDLSALSHKERQLVFINLHNTMALHARAALGAPSSMLERKRNAELCAYNIGGLLYSPAVILEGMLRGNTALVAPSDPRFRFVCKVGDGLSLLSLCDGTLSLPRPRVYVEGSWATDLRQNVSAWLAVKDVVQFSPGVNQLVLPRVLKLFLEEFGGTKESLVAQLYDVFPDAVKVLLKEVREASADLDVKFVDHDDAAW